jgi:WD40 repeat protein
LLLLPKRFLELRTSAFLTFQSAVGFIDIESSFVSTTFHGHTAIVSDSLAWIPGSDSLFLSSSEDLTVRLWDVRYVHYAFHYFPHS